jgi:uncharacterized secreted protein with C-terminal beta-propeller domain
MRGNKGFIKLLLLVFIIAVIICPLTAWALTDNEYIELKHREYIAADKIWTITFDDSIDKETINDDNIFVLDSKNKRVSLKLKIDDECKDVKIVPVEKYKEGETYIIYVKKGIRSSEGEKILKSGIKMKFTVSNIPLVGSCENFINLMNKAEKINEKYDYYRGENYITLDEADVDYAANEEKKTGISSDKVNDDYSKTNTQVEGVDEADIVKTDGEYIYTVSKYKQVLNIIKAYPSDKMEAVNMLNYYDENFYPDEIYVDDKYLVVIGDQHEYIEDYYKRDMWYPNYGGVTKAVVYDISNKKDIKKIREVSINGSYNTSRKIGSKLYLIANKYLYYYRYIPYTEYDNDMDDKQQQEFNKGMLPAYKDSVLGDEFVFVDYSKIHYYPDSIEPNYMIIAEINLDKNDEPANIFTSLGSSENVYVSENNLYTTVTRYDYKQINVEEVIKQWIGHNYRDYKINTEIYKFALNDGKVEFKSKGIVPGNVVNQFSMDEHEGNLRIATTTGDMWVEDDDISKNNLYVLDENMSITGKIEGIAPGEKIYSVRFVRDRAYMVTFRNIDPFFVIDLKDERKPKILGALKIPGYSDYLHPYDENHIIGIGKDTFEIDIKDEKGNVVGSNAYYEGIKMALFDVTDVKNPIEKFKVKIGDRGTTSEVLYNHKALLFSKEKNLITFPVTVMNVKEDKIMEDDIYSRLQYGQFTFQGAYIYKIDEKDGFNLKGKITHLSDEEYLKSSYYGYYGDKTIKRIIYIGKNLYTISDSILKVNDLESLKEICEIKLYDN